MNKKVPFMLMTLSTLLLAACDSKVSQEKFVEQLSAVEANITLDSEKLDNVHMQNKLGINKIDYKEGEFYVNTTDALALIIPIITELYTWREGDSETNYKYYHAEKHTITSNNKWNEISKEQFDVYMANGRAEVCAKLNEGPTACRNFLKDEPEGGYYNVKNSFAKTISSEYKMTSNSNYKAMENEQEVEKTYKTTFIFKNGLPVKYTVKNNGSESFYKYSFGKAELRTLEKPAS